jgi:hypothetical protein
MPARKKTICLSEDEYRKLVQARGKYEHESGEKPSGFGEFIAFIAGLYLFEKLKEGRKRRRGGNL